MSQSEAHAKGEKKLGKNKKPETAIVLSLIAGILILISAAQSFLFSITGEFSKWPGLIGSEWMTGLWSGIAFNTVGMIIGIIVILSAVMLNSRPKNHTVWGSLILVFSIISFIVGWSGWGMDIPSLILGALGGIFAITWKTKIIT